MNPLRVPMSLLVLLAAACHSAPLSIRTDPIGPNERSLGEVEGKATGLMLFQVVPLGQNTRFESAYAAALKKAPGATRIVNPVVSESWFWAWVLNGYSFSVRGTAVGPK